MFTTTERKILFNQYEIIKALYPDRADECDNAMEILSSGYRGLYANITPAVTEGEEVPEAVYQQVCDILDMFRCFNRGAIDHGYTLPDEARFQGFDGNHDEGYFSLAIFLRRDLDKWAELADQPDNSHGSANIGTYLEMLSRFNGAPNRIPPTLEALEAIVFPPK